MAKEQEKDPSAFALMKAISKLAPFIFSVWPDPGLLGSYYSCLHEQRRMAGSFSHPQSGGNCFYEYF